MKKKDVELVFSGADEKSWQELLDDLRPQGEWLNTSPYDDKGECSLCCYLSKKYYHFCPNCGATMNEATYNVK